MDLFILTDQKKAILEKIRQYKTKRKISPILVNVNEFINLKNHDKPLYDEIGRGITLWERD